VVTCLNSSVLEIKLGTALLRRRLLRLKLGEKKESNWVLQGCLQKYKSLRIRELSPLRESFATVTKFILVHSLKENQLPN
jgi:hypothetical protein